MTDSLLAIDTETTGLDLHHGAAPYFITTCDQDGNQEYYEWPVDPLTRKVIVDHEELADATSIILGNTGQRLVLQNSKFDVAALNVLAPSFGKSWPWQRTEDTLILGHLLASNQPHNLTDMTLQYVGVDLQPYEDALETAVKKCRSMVQQARLKVKRGKEDEKGIHNWRIAEPGLPDMPSMKDSGWKADGWLPRAMVLHACRTLDFSLLPPFPQQPTVHRVTSCTVRIDRGSKWGNPYKVTVDTPRTVAVRKYLDHVLDSYELLESLPELYCKRLGCHCTPSLCHGDILRALCHPWFTVLRDYANSDSESTLAVFKVMYNTLLKRKLLSIYRERLKCLPIVYGMEQRGVTVSGSRTERLVNHYTHEAGRLRERCVTIANSYDYHLELPKSGRNKSLDEFVWGVMGLEKVYNPKSRTGGPTLDAKSAVPHYLATLPLRSKERAFIQALTDSRSRVTSLGYLEGYNKFRLAYTQNVGTVNGVEFDAADWYVLHPSLNPCGTDTLRCSSSNPNSQNISKKEIICSYCHGEGCPACDGKGVDPYNLRYTFGPPPGWEWYSLDAKNIEARLPAYLSGEADLIALYENPDKPPYYGSAHLLNFHTVYPDIWDRELKEVGIDKVGPHCKKKYASTWYQYCKNGGFAVQYGAVEKANGWGTADRAFNKRGAHRLLKQRFSKLEKLNQQCIAYANKYGYVETIPDREVDPDRGYPLMVTRTERGRVLETVPLNYMIQGSAMYWTMKGMARCQARLDEWQAQDNFNGHMVMQVHDELVFAFETKGDPVAEAKGQSPEGSSNLIRIRGMQSLMAKGGEDFGIPTPVGIEYHKVHWGEGVTL